MKITEPMTMITDYLLGGYIIYLSYQIYLHADSGLLLSSGFFVLAFVSSAIGAFVGGTSHGFKTYFSDRQNIIIWKITLYTIGIGSMTMLIGTVIATIQNSVLAIVLILFAVIKFIIYAWWMIRHDEFMYVILDYAPTMLLIIIIKGVSYFQYEDTSSIWIIAGIVVSFIAAGIQASGKGLHKHLNHNDIFHLVQMPAMYLIYRGVVLFKDLL
jgi:hypothetical protein